MGQASSNSARRLSVTVQEYFDALQRSIAAQSIVVQQSLVFRDSGKGSGFVEGYLFLPKDHRLYIAEYILTEPVFHRRKYRFQLLDSSQRLVRRWDDAPHHPHLPTHPHHCHMPNGDIVASPPMDLPSVLDAITVLLK